MLFIFNNGCVNQLANFLKMWRMFLLILPGPLPGHHCLDFILSHRISVLLPARVMWLLISWLLNSVAKSWSLSSVASRGLWCLLRETSFSSALSSHFFKSLPRTNFLYWIFSYWCFSAFDYDLFLSSILLALKMTAMFSKFIPSIQVSSWSFSFICVASCCSAPLPTHSWCVYSSGIHPVIHSNSICWAPTMCQSLSDVPIMQYW